MIGSYPSSHFRVRRALQVHGDHGVFTAGGAGGSRAATLHGSGAGFGAFANGETTIDPITGKITKKWQHDKLTATKDSG